MPGRNKVAVAITAMSIAVLGGGIGAAGAQGQSEVLQGIATTISGRGASCPIFAGNWISVSASFNAAGTATGPYPGQFTNANANGGVFGYWRPFGEQLRVSIPFMIDSGTTTITGTITNPYPWPGGFFICSGGALVGFDAAYANGARYTATIQRPGQPAESISGNAELRGNFYVQPGAQTTVTETLVFP